MTQERLAPSCNASHAVYVYPISHDGEVVACKVEIGHGVNHKVGIAALGRPHKVGELERGGMCKFELVPSHTANELAYECARIRNVVEPFTNCRYGMRSRHATLAQEVIGKTGAQRRVGIEGLYHQVLKIHDVHTLIAQHHGKGIVFGACHLMKRYVIKKEGF